MCPLWHLGRDLLYLDVEGFGARPVRIIAAYPQRVGVPAAKDKRSIATRSVLQSEGVGRLLEAVWRR